jgi:hypothetical protein
MSNAPPARGSTSGRPAHATAMDIRSRGTTTRWMPGPGATELGWVER